MNMQTEHRGILCRNDRAVELTACASIDGRGPCIEFRIRDSECFNADDAEMTVAASPEDVIRWAYHVIRLARSAKREVAE